MNRNFYKRLSQIILEAEEDETEATPTNDTDTSDIGGEEGDNLTEEDLDDQTNNYQMDDSDFDEGSDGDMENVEDESSDSENEEMSDEVDNMEDETTEQNNNDASKKYMLASQYKELLLVIANLEKSMNSKRELETNPEVIHYIYIVLDKITNLKSKINFFVINNFITKPYEELLTSFLFLKKELELIISLVEKLLDEKEDN